MLINYLVVDINKMKMMKMFCCFGVENFKKELGVCTNISMKKHIRKGADEGENHYA